MSIPSADIFASPELLNDDFLRLELVDDLPDDLRPVERWIADQRTAALARQKQNPGKDKLVARLSITAINPDAVAFADAKLMATILDNCVHPLGLPSGAVSTMPFAIDQRCRQPVPSNKAAMRSSESSRRSPS